MHPVTPTPLIRMGGQVVGVVVLLAAACNQITGVGDLNVAPEACTLENEPACSGGTNPLDPPPDMPVGGVPPGGGAGGEGGSGSGGGAAGESSNGGSEVIPPVIPFMPPPGDMPTGNGA